MRVQRQDAGAWLITIRPTGDQHGNIRVWDLTANACSCELVPEVGTAVRSLTVAMDGSLVVAANNQGALIVHLTPNDSRVIGL